jgi:hypothetical protein
VVISKGHGIKLLELHTMEDWARPAMRNSFWDTAVLDVELEWLAPTMATFEVE